MMCIGGGKLRKQCVISIDLHRPVGSYGDSRGIFTTYLPPLPHFLDKILDSKKTSHF